MKITPREGLTIRAALLLGFGLTFGLWLSSGFYFARRVAAMQAQAETINTSYIRAQELLSTVRRQVLLGSAYARDALLDPRPDAIREYRRQMVDTLATVDIALQQYAPFLESRVEQQRIDQLRSEVNDLRLTMLDVLDGDSRRWPNEARTLLRSRILPRRENVLRVTEDVQSLNRSAFVRQQAESAAGYRATQRRIWLQLGLALSASFIIGLFATRFVGRLEDRLRRQRTKDLENTRDLQRLSAQLITVQEEERRTIARELHDEVGQVLTAIKVELAIAQRAVDAVGGPAHLLESARAITDGALHTVRDLSRLLHPAVLDDLGLPAAIDSYLRESSGRHSFRIELLHERMEGRLAQETEATAYRVVQEAVTNVVKHAHATTLRVYLHRLAHTVLITIEDDGVGFETSQVKPSSERGGLGLLSIRERVALLRGTVRLESAPGKGTRLTIELPATSRMVQSTERERAHAEMVHG